MVTPVPELVTLHVWTVPPTRVAWAAGRMATDRRRVRRAPGATFAKLLGTGRGETFGVREANPRRWALLMCWASADAATQWEISRTASRWRAVADETWRLELAPLTSRGKWSKRTPFGAPAPGPHDGLVVAVTRARLRPRRAATFWRAVPPVAAELHTSPGLRFTMGIGEAPAGLQGTFSLWDSADALKSFAYSSPQHLDAIARTSTVGWYAEELFARLAVLASSGTVDGRDPAA